MKHTLPVAMSLALATLLSAGAASAQPFEIYAKYEPTKDSSAKSTAAITIPLSDNDLIPRTTVDYLFDGIFIRAKTDDVSAMALANLADFTFAVTCEAPACGAQENASPTLRGGIPTSSASPIFDYLFLPPERVPGSGAVARLNVEIKARFTQQYLCGAEVELRRTGTAVKDWDATIAPYVFRGASDKPPPRSAQRAAKPKAPPDAVKGDELAKSGLPDQIAAIGLLAYQLGDSKRPIFSSFCPQIDAVVDWKTIAGPGPSDESEAARDGRIAAVKARQRHELSLLVGAYLKTTRKIGKVEVKPPSDDAPDDIYIGHHQAIAVIREPTEVFDFKEVDDVNHPLRIHDTHLVSQSATINVVHAPGFCNLLPRPCDVIRRAYFTASLEGPDPSNTTATTPAVVARDVPLSNGGEGWSASVPLKDFLYKQVTLKLSYKLGGTTFLLRQETFTVENLGWVTKLPPVIADVASLIKRGGPSAANPNDPAYRSSIPISWAYNANANDGRHVAITLPWVVGYNPRQAPRLSDYVSVFAHVSFVLPVTSNATNTTTLPAASGANAGSLNAQVAVGTGLQLVNAFSLAWGLTTDHATNYLLLGISAPDLVNAFK